MVPCPTMCTALSFFITTAIKTQALHYTRTSGPSSLLLFKDLKKPSLKFDQNTLNITLKANRKKKKYLLATPSRSMHFIVVLKVTFLVHMQNTHTHTPLKTISKYKVTLFSILDCNEKHPPLYFNEIKVSTTIKVNKIERI